VEAFNGTVKLSGTFSGTVSAWKDSFQSFFSDTWAPQVTQFWDTSFLQPKGMANMYGDPVQVIRILFSSTPQNPLKISVDLRSVLSQQETRVVKLAWYNRSSSALFWTPICNSTATRDGIVSATLGLDLLTSPYFGNWTASCSSSATSAPFAKSCQKGAFLVVVTTPWSFCHNETQRNETSPGPTSTPEPVQANCSNGTFRAAITVGLPSVNEGQEICTEGYTGPPCAPCEAGTFKNMAGSSKCMQCGPDTFSPTIGATCNLTCLSCPAFSTTNGSSGKSECSCNAGYHGVSGNLPSIAVEASGSTLSLAAWKIQQQSWMNYTLCVPCKPGEYKNAWGAGACTPCGAGTYQPSWNATTCISCQEYSTSPEGSINASLCGCNPGYTLSNNSCQPCPAGTYKEVDGSSKCLFCDFGKYSNSTRRTTGAACISCPKYTTTRYEGSSLLSDCICEPGYYNGSSSFDCLPCPLGSYKDAAGTGGCTLCAPSTYNPTTAGSFLGACLPCPFGSNSLAGSNSSDQCICIAGYGLEDYCMPCGPGEFSTDQDMFCRKCPNNTYSSTLGAISSSTCLPCSSNSFTTGPGAVQAADCKCDFGFSGLDGGTCTICQPGTYSDTQGPEPCTRCPLGSYSAAYGAVDSSTCRPCPANSYTVDSAQTSNLSCYCNLGFEGKGGGPCSPCQPGTYSDTFSNNSMCASCPRETYSNATAAEDQGTCSPCVTFSRTSGTGRTSVADCICIQGYDYVNSAGCSPTDAPVRRCQACSIGYYQVPGIGCVPCPGTHESYLPPRIV
jgi:hypothetical protein